MGAGWKVGGEEWTQKKWKVPGGAAPLLEILMEENALSSTLVPTLLSQNGLW